MMSALLSGASARLGTLALENFCPSRLKMRNSIPVAAAMRAKVGTSRRQSEDQSSEMASIFAGPLGWATSHFRAAAWASVRTEFSNASTEEGALVEPRPRVRWRAPRFSGRADVSDVLVEGHALREAFGRDN